MKILVTSGGTTEYIDEVRVLTNISTGNLGSIIADTFAKHGFEVTYLSSKSSILPTNSKMFNQ
jgi:phosphopantothenoylcysteine synthetase/decarboxylase